MEMARLRRERVGEEGRRIEAEVETEEGTESGASV